ncbi:LuxR C-terminal-related transcriptional regulator [Novosphingobium sp. SL115]|uniref:response regulator transcription factor n=1 Tax=Novosphingobium sp. SL115 TaxID=2995150 RepID=UPI002274951F|nr:LuxR C-terminal-related transcriptional regulator [Novosphingobium sp. SL115]MCY1669462.1 LuxR C-terminal-related transcriptional regulator [Novosphingobium sp. SL115]
MATKRYLHIIDSHAGRRAQIYHDGTSLGYHCEIHDGAAEFLKSKMHDGLVLLYDGGPASAVHAFLSRTAALGAWFGIVAYCENPAIAQVIAAIKGGALSFIGTPENPDVLDSALQAAAEEADRQYDARSNCAKACANLARLSRRENQVLELLVHGDSNKTIARHLDISPRTVEIHRMKLLGKLGAKNSADAIRLHVTASCALMVAA